MARLLAVVSLGTAACAADPCESLRDSVGQTHITWGLYTPTPVLSGTPPGYIMLRAGYEAARLRSLSEYGDDHSGYYCSPNITSPLPGTATVTAVGGEPITIPPEPDPLWGTSVPVIGLGTYVFEFVDDRMEKHVAEMTPEPFSIALEDTADGGIVVTTSPGPSGTEEMFVLTCDGAGQVGFSSTPLSESSTKIVLANDQPHGGKVDVFVRRMARASLCEPEAHAGWGCQELGFGLTYYASRGCP